MGRNGIHLLIMVAEGKLLFQMAWTFPPQMYFELQLCGMGAELTAFSYREQMPGLYLMWAKVFTFVGMSDRLFPILYIQVLFIQSKMVKMREFLIGILLRNLLELVHGKLSSGLVLMQFQIIGGWVLNLIKARLIGWN